MSWPNGGGNMQTYYYLWKKTNLIKQTESNIQLRKYYKNFALKESKSYKH